MATIVDSIEELKRIYDGGVSEAAIKKVANRLTPKYEEWISNSYFCVLSTVGEEGVDNSPRGDNGPVVKVVDESTLLMPDWRGNNRLDSLLNIIRDKRASLMFFVTGSNTVIRVNGGAFVSADDDLINQFEVKGKKPKSVIVFAVKEVYSQCAKAMIRSDLWKRDCSGLNLPTVGDFMVEQTGGEFDGKTYDGEWRDRAEKTMW